MTPSVTIGMKSQLAEKAFPDENSSARPTYNDFTLQGSLQTEFARGAFNSQSQFDIAGSSFRQEALRFGEKGNAAPRIDLASYLMQFKAGRARVQVGHVAFGTNRHLINSFSSRGITITLPVTSQSDFSVAAMNGTSIVGWDNFFGLNRRKHQIVSGAFGHEFIAQRPGGLRVEAGIMHGSLLPLANFNQGVGNDAEQSKGASFRIVASDASGRFRLTGGPDEFVSVTCRMTGGGARTPFALTDVKLSFSADKPVMFVGPGEKLPSIKADIAYNGTGRLKGRWEVVLPGEELPAVRDLLTEATLPAEERGLQRRYTQVSRFNVFLPPTGKFTLPGPDPARLPSTVEGQYLILLRVEASDDKEADSSLAAVGAGSGVVHSGAVAGFPLPPLRYYVGSGGGKPDPAKAKGEMSQLQLEDNFAAQPGTPVDFRWSEVEHARYYRIEIADMQQAVILSALMPNGVASYRAPSWLKDKTGDGNLRWRVEALDQAGNPIKETPWRNLRLAKP